MQDASTSECKQKYKHLRGRARGGEPLDALLIETYGLVSAVIQKTLGFKLYDSQLIAATVMNSRVVAELATGEGKTLVAALPAVLQSLPGKGVHVITVNDYLTERDAGLLRPVYEYLGLTVGTLLPTVKSSSERRAAYHSDITYGTGSAFAFDFLRDRLRFHKTKTASEDMRSVWLNEHSPVTSQNSAVQRNLFAAIVDEADSVFIDEGRTPLVISSGRSTISEEEKKTLLWADSLARQMKEKVDFEWDEKDGTLFLTQAGQQRFRFNGFPQEDTSKSVYKLRELLESSLRAHHRLFKDKHYVVDRNRVIMINQQTGRLLPGRQFGGGQHQALEIKEGTAVTKGGESSARITYQTYFEKYERLCGMTGTAKECKWELTRIYRLGVVRCPTNKPIIRTWLCDSIHANHDAKLSAILEEVQKYHSLGRPVLVGTETLAQSEQMSRLFTEKGIAHQLLNARQTSHEANVIAKAGEWKAVTIATNMAGRGTDIKISDEVRELGGLVVIGTERHASRRVDLQLIGRTGRQGDPGTCQFFLSLEDDLLEVLGKRAVLQLRLKAKGKRELSRFQYYFDRAQQAKERQSRRLLIDLAFRQKKRNPIMESLHVDPHVD